MKNVFLAFFLVLACSPAFAGNCSSCPKVVTKTVLTTREVVSAPVRFVGGLRARVAARRAARLEARAARAEVAACSPVTGCECEPKAE
jgi:hypothetical protein